MPTLHAAQEDCTRAPARAVKPDFGLTVADLRELAHLVPERALDLVRAIGAEAAVTLMRQCAGAQLVIPKHPDHNPAGARRWALLAEIVGEAAMPNLAAQFGGCSLDVPCCARMLAAKRNEWVRNRFDELTRAAGPALSAREAVLTIGLDLAAAGMPLTYRAIERITTESK